MTAARAATRRGANDPASTAVVEFRHVTKTYSRTHTHALKNVDFRVDKGEFVYLTGHSGAGKSTLLSLMLRRIIPTEGSVLVNGFDVARIREGRLPQVRRSIGMVFQDHRLLGEFSRELPEVRERFIHRSVSYL